MSSGYFERKSDVADLRQRLKKALEKKESKACKSAVKKTIQYMTLGIDVSSLFMDMIMASATYDIVQKKLVYLYICTCAESNSELALLTVNTLVKDAMGDHNPMVRGLALRSMLNMRISMIVEYVKGPLLAGLDDKISYVRRTAVIGCLKLFKLAPDIFEDMDLLGKLYVKQQDPEPQVSVNAFIAIDEILTETGGFQFNKENVHYLLGRLPTFNEWSQCIVLEKIVRYNPQDEDEILEYLNFLDDRLNHANKGVVLSAIKVFMHFTKSLDYLKSDIYDRIRTPILTILPSAIPEIVFTTLNNVSVLIQLKPRLFHNDYKFFFLRSPNNKTLLSCFYECRIFKYLAFNFRINSDPSYVCHKKLDVLTKLVTEGNMSIIVDEMREYVHNPDLLISSKAVQSIGAIAVRDTHASDICVPVLLDLLRLGVDHITGYCLESLQELLGSYKNIAQQVLLEISNSWDLVQHHSLGKAALVWMYGEFGEDIPDSPYRLEELTNCIEEVQTVGVKLNLLTAMFKLFLKRPPECQKAFGKLLKYCIDEENDMDVRDRALFYYRLMRQDLNKAKSVIFSKENEPLPVNANIPTINEEDFSFKEFNTLSVVYGQPSESFLSESFSAVAESGNSLDVVEESYAGDSAVENEAMENEPTGVVIGNILDLGDEEIGEEEQGGLKLDKNVSLKSDEFKTKWFNATNAMKFEKQFTVTPEHEEILSVMRNSDIQCLAANQPSAPLWKFFFYAKQFGKADYLLVELVVQRNQNQMTAQIKSTADENILFEFTEFYKNLFVGRWIAFSS